MGKQWRASLLKDHRISGSRFRKRGRNQISAIPSPGLNLSNSPSKCRTPDLRENRQIRHNYQIRHNRQIDGDCQNRREVRLAWVKPLLSRFGFACKYGEMQSAMKRPGLPAFASVKPSISSPFGTWLHFPLTCRSTHKSALSLRQVGSTFALIFSCSYSGGLPTRFTPCLPEKYLITGLHRRRREQRGCNVTHYDLQNPALRHRRESSGLPH